MDWPGEAIPGVERDQAMMPDETSLDAGDDEEILDPIDEPDIFGGCDDEYE